MYALADAARPRLLPRARAGDLRRDGAGRDHRGRRVPLPPPRARRRPYDDPNAIGRGGDRGRRARPGSGSRCSTPATCTAASARARGRAAALLRRRRRAWAERVDALARRVAAVADRRRDPQRPRGRPRVGGASVAGWAGERERRCTPTSPSSPPRTRPASRRYGVTPTAVLAEAGALDERFTAVHATHLDRRATSRCSARAGARCCLCPTTERDLADGIGRRARLRDAGAALALGSDSQAVIDLFEEARAVELDERLATRRARPPRRGRRCSAPRRADGHASIGWPDGGADRGGALADLVTSRSTASRLAGTAAGTALDSIVFAATAADVRRRDRRRRARSSATAPHVAIDVAAELAAAIAAPGAPMSSLAIDRHRPAGHQRPGARRGPARDRPRRGAGLRRTAASPRSSAPGSPPTSGSTPAAAA